MELTISASVIERVRRIATDVAGPNAASVDREAKFPKAAINELRADKLFSACIPKKYGGLGCNTSEVATACRILAESCSSTALIFAMHHVQAFGLSQYAQEQPYFLDFLADAAVEQYLIASATSEVGTGGNLRMSKAPIECHGKKFTLSKHCSVLSYAQDADAILVTARRDSNAASGDQVLALVLKENYQLEEIGNWDSMGMRGTCSVPVLLKVKADISQILNESFRIIASETFVPLSHIFWAACWLGIAESAVSKVRARFRGEGAHSSIQNGVGSEKLAITFSELQILRSIVQESAKEFDRLINEPDKSFVLRSTEFALRSNNLKLSASRLVTKICLSCLELCGILGYLEDSKYSVSRELRDGLSSLSMINNLRIALTNATLLQLPETPSSSGILI